MLAEVLLSLSGHPSSLFSSTTLGSTSTSSLSTFPSLPLHPSEIESLKSLQLLSSRYARIREFSKNQLDLVRRTSLRNAGVRVSRNKKGKEKQQENQDNHLSSHLSPLCSTLLNILKEYEDLILGLQKIILERREEPTGAATFKVAKDGFVSLNSIKALVQGWVEPFTSLNLLIDELIAGPSTTSSTSADLQELASSQWTGGQLLNLLSSKSSSTVGKTQECMISLQRNVQRSWSEKLVDWVCFGEATNQAGGNGDYLVQIEMEDVEFEEEERKLDHHDFIPGGRIGAGVGDSTLTSASTSSTGGPIYKFKANSLPSQIDERTKDSILYVGRALATVRRSELSSRLSSNSSSSHRSGGKQGKLPEFMLEKHRKMLMEVGPCWLNDTGTGEEGIRFDRSIEMIREDVSEWIWRNVLTKETVLGALHDLGSIFLHRSGYFHQSFLSTFSDFQESKAKSKVKGKIGVNEKAIKISDLERILSRASIGTELEDDASLECVKWSLPSMKGASKSSSQAGRDDYGKPAKNRGPAGGAGRVRFDDFFLREARIQLHYSALYPLDLFLSPQDLSSYSRLFSYFSAFRKIKQDLVTSWHNLSRSQRARRKWTGAEDGGIDGKESKMRTGLLRKSFGLNRLMSWFIGNLMEFCMNDVVDVQFSRLIDQLGGGEKTSTLGQRNRGEDEDLIPPPVSNSNSPTLPLSNLNNEMPPPASTLPLRSKASAPSLRKSNLSSSPSKASTELPPVGGSRRQSVASSIVTNTTVAGNFRRGGLNSANSVKDNANSIFGSQSTVNRTITPTRSVFGGAGNPGSYPRNFGGKGGSFRPNSTPTLTGSANLGANLSANQSLDFASLKLIHESFLSFILDGTLLSSEIASGKIREILETCRNFTERINKGWEGDILPGLLSEGNLADRNGGDEEGGKTSTSNRNSLDFRMEFLNKISAELDTRLHDFFSLLSNASRMNRGGGSTNSATGGNVNNRAGSTSFAGEMSLSNISFSMPLPSRTATQNLKSKGGSGQAGQDKERDRMNEVRLEADGAARGHLEQLLLRLDYNGHFGQEAQKREEEEERREVDEGDD